MQQWNWCNTVLLSWAQRTSVCIAWTMFQSFSCNTHRASKERPLHAIIGNNTKCIQNLNLAKGRETKTRGNINATNFCDVKHEALRHPIWVPHRHLSVTTDRAVSTRRTLHSGSTWQTFLQSICLAWLTWPTEEWKIRKHSARWTCMMNLGMTYSGCGSASTVLIAPRRENILVDLPEILSLMRQLAIH